MTPLLMIRHGPTAWNQLKRMQGRTDLPLCDDGRRVVGRWSLPEEFMEFRWVSSPLIRAVETARLLGGDPELEPCLVEMSWGKWEGLSFPELRQEFGGEFAAQLARGLDFRPTGGESPRDVQERLTPWLQALATPTIAVCHKGLIQAVYSLATGWDMRGKPAEKPRDNKAHLFYVEAGAPSVERMNIPLETE